MAFKGNLGQLDLLRRSNGDSKIWNHWREAYPAISPDLQGMEMPGAQLSRVDLSKANLFCANLQDADLRWAKLSGANLVYAQLQRARLDNTEILNANLEEAQLTGAHLPEATLRHSDLTAASFRRANLHGANLGRIEGEDVIFADADLTGANLEKADLWMANLSDARLGGSILRNANLNQANLTRADLSGSDLIRVRMTGVNLCGANLQRAKIYGLSAWDVRTDAKTNQSELSIAPPGQAGGISVDNIEVAQFINLLVDNKKIRSVIDTITSKVVLILGRFTPERKVVLDALREELRKRDYLAVLFDFDKPVSKDLTGTVSTLANMARFIIADLTDPSCIPHELAMIIPTTVVPLQPIILEGMREYAMFIDLKKRHHWVLEPYSYNTHEHLIADLSERVIGPAEAKVRELRGVRPG